MMLRGVWRVGRGEVVKMRRPCGVFQFLLLGAALLWTSGVALPQSAAPATGWYTAAQATAGAKAYQSTCATCHGAKLQGGMGPALVGRQFWLNYAGKKASTLWSDVHTSMPMSAPGSVSAKRSVDIMAFLLQKNGVPAGSTPLNDTVDLSKALPAK
jgi:mono/diheme cytochrome c family protein